MSKQNASYFITPWLLFFLVLFAATFQYDKAMLHLQMNSFRTEEADIFFKFITGFGSQFPFFIIIILLFYRYSYGIFLLASQVTGGVIVYTLKNIFAAPRPKTYFALYHPELTLPAVPDYKLHAMNSFPSGHTVTAFALFFAIALLVKNKWLKTLFFVAAALTAYSRVYLSQHFATDLLAGSVIGVLAVYICYPAFLKIDKKRGGDSIVQVIRRKKNSETADNSK